MKSTAEHQLEDECRLTHIPSACRLFHTPNKTLIPVVSLCCICSATIIETVCTSAFTIKASTERRCETLSFDCSFSPWWSSVLKFTTTWSGVKLLIQGKTFETGTANKFTAAVRRRKWKHPDGEQTQSELYFIPAGLIVGEHLLSFYYSRHNIVWSTSAVDMF